MRTAFSRLFCCTFTFRLDTISFAPLTLIAECGLLFGAFVRTNYDRLFT